MRSVWTFIIPTATVLSLTGAGLDGLIAVAVPNSPWLLFLLSTGVLMLLSIGLGFALWTLHRRSSLSISLRIAEEHLPVVESLKATTSKIQKEFDREVRFDQNARQRLWTLWNTVCDMSSLSRLGQRLPPILSDTPDLARVREVNYAAVKGLERTRVLLEDAEAGDHALVQKNVVKASEAAYDVASVHLARYEEILERVLGRS